MTGAMNSASVFAGTDGGTRTRFITRTSVATGAERGIYGACGREHEQPVAIGLRTDDRLGGDVAGGAGPVLGDERLTERLRQPLRHDTWPQCSIRQAGFGRGRCRRQGGRGVGAVITTSFTLPDTICDPRRRSFSDTHFKQSCRRAPVCRGRRLASTLYALLAYRLLFPVLIPPLSSA